MGIKNAVVITAQLIELAEIAKRIATPSAYAERVQRAKELLTIVMAEKKVSRLRAMTMLANQVPPNDNARLWLAAAVVEMTK